jgi:hypothetical protein
MIEKYEVLRDVFNKMRICKALGVGVRHSSTLRMGSKGDVEL